MITTLLIVHSIIVLMMIGIILLQKGESGGIVSSQTASMVSARGAKNFLTRTTAILATLFFVNSLILALLVKGNLSKQREILKEQPTAAQVVDAPQQDASLAENKKALEETVKNHLGATSEPTSTVAEKTPASVVVPQKKAASQAKVAKKTAKKPQQRTALAGQKKTTKKTS